MIALDRVPDIAEQTREDAADAYVWVEDGELMVASFEDDDAPGDLYTYSWWCDLDGYIWGDYNEPVVR